MTRDGDLDCRTALLVTFRAERRLGARREAVLGAGVFPLGFFAIGQIGVLDIDDLLGGGSIDGSDGGAPPTAGAVGRA